MLCETSSQTTSACSAYSASGTWTQCRVLLGFTHSTSSFKGEKAIQQGLEYELEAAAADHLLLPCSKTLNPISRRKEVKKKKKKLMISSSEQWHYRFLRGGSKLPMRWQQLEKDTGGVREQEWEPLRQYWIFSIIRHPCLTLCIPLKGGGGREIRCGWGGGVFPICVTMAKQNAHPSPPLPKARTASRKKKAL